MFQKDLDAMDSALDELAAQTHSSSRLTTIIVALVCLIIGLVIALTVTLGIINPLHCVQDVCVSVAEGDLTQRVNMLGKDEIARTGQALDKATENTPSTVRTLSESVVALSSAAAEHAAESPRPLR